MRDRIRPPKELERDVLDRLKDDFVFDTKQKGLMFAAAIGCRLHGDAVDQTEIDQYGEGIRLDYFRSQQDEGFIDVLSVAKANELNVLDPDKQEERVILFEKYALLGLREMKKYCYDNRPIDPLLGILDLLDSMSKRDTDDLPGLDETAKQIGEYF